MVETPIEQIGLVSMSCIAKNYLLMTSSKGEIDPLIGGNENAKENV